MPARGQSVRYASLDTPVGRVLIAYRGATVVRVSRADSERAFVDGLATRYGEPPEADREVPARLRESVLAHIEGKRTYTNIDLSELTPFQRRVLRATAAVPYGQVRTYGEIAEAVGAPAAARAVGSALARNPAPLLIPCHRVVRAGGELGNYGGGGPEEKRRLLRREGAL